MSIIHPHYYFPFAPVPIEVLLWWRDNEALFLRVLTHPKYRQIDFVSGKSGNLLIYPPKCNIMENEMNGRKPKKHESRLGNSDDKPLPFRWLNIPLTDQDISILEREEASLEQLAFSFICLGMHGLGLSVKYDSVRESYSVSIYRPSDAVNREPLGISGSSSDLRDALLVSLYRFNSCLEGSFDNAPSEDATIQPRRFR